MLSTLALKSTSRRWWMSLWKTGARQTRFNSCRLQWETVFFFFISCMFYLFFSFLIVFVQAVWRRFSPFSASGLTLPSGYSLQVPLWSSSIKKKKKKSMHNQICGGRRCRTQDLPNCVCPGVKIDLLWVKGGIRTSGTVRSVQFTLQSWSL